MSDLRMELIQGQLNDIEENVRSIKATWGNTIMTLDNIKSGLKADRQKAIDEAYQRGIDDAWEAAKKICTNWMISDRVLAEIFGQCKDIDTIMHENTAQEAINKIKAYEEQQKADAEIKVGDEVCFVFAGGETIEPFIVFSIKDYNGKKYYEGIQTSDGRWVNGGLKYYKTGRHFPQVAELLKAMKGGDA